MIDKGVLVLVDGTQLREELNAQRRKVDFDSYDVSIDELIRRVERNRIEIAPVYQRQFRWGAERQSALVESFLLGVPVPPLFMATNNLPGEQIQWEVVDGLQRLLTLVHFAGGRDARRNSGFAGSSLELIGLEKLTMFNGLVFEALPNDVQDLFTDRPAKVIVLNDKSDKQVRFDLFERLNTGGLELTDQEVRECVYRGEFIDLLSEMSTLESFRMVVNIPENKLKDGTPQELVLRFYAYLDRYEEFDHSVKDFLNVYTQDLSEQPASETLQMRSEFSKVFEFLSKCFPDGISRRNRKTTPINLYEGVAVGAALALRCDPEIRVQVNPDWLADEAMTKATTGATNSRTQVKRRVEYARDCFLAK